MNEEKIYKAEIELCELVAKHKLDGDEALGLFVSIIGRIYIHSPYSDDYIKLCLLDIHEAVKEAREDLKAENEFKKAMNREK